MEIKKYWLKSKQILLNISNAFTGALGYIAFEFNGLISNNLEWIKTSGIDVKYIFALMAINGLLGIYLRVTSKNEKLVTKQEATNANTPAN